MVCGVWCVVCARVVTTTMASLADESSPKKPKTDGVEVNAAARPRLVIVFSGKRKSGKDFVTDRLVVAINKAAVAAGLLGEAPAAAEAAGGGTGTGSGAGSAVPTLCCEIGRLSAPLKKAYADENGLDFAELLSDGPYKEKYRASMVKQKREGRRGTKSFSEEYHEAPTASFPKIVHAGPTAVFARPVTHCRPTSPAHRSCGVRKSAAQTRGTLRTSWLGRCAFPQPRPVVNL